MINYEKDTLQQLDSQQFIIQRLQHNHACGVGVHEMEQGRDVANYEEPRMHARKAVVRVYAGIGCSHLDSDAGIRDKPVVVRACVSDVLCVIRVRMDYQVDS